MGQDSDDAFSQAVYGWLDGPGDSHSRQDSLADEFGVSTAEVNRWARGSARPHPSKQKQILRYLKENP